MTNHGERPRKNTRFVWCAAISALLAPPISARGESPAASKSPTVTAKVLMAQGDELENANKHDEALAKYQEAAKLDPGSYDAWIDVAELQENLKHFPEAAKAYEAASKANPEIPGAWKGQARLAIAAGDFAGALRVADEFEKVDPGSPEPSRIRGDIAVKQGRDAEAYQQFKRAVALDPRRGDRMSLAALALKLGHRGEALQLIRDMTVASPAILETVRKDPRFAELAADAEFLAIKPAAATAETGTEEGKRAPDFTLPRLAAGKEAAAPVSLSSLRGKTVLLNFWATWCPPCRREWPSLQKFHESSKGDPNTAVVAVSEDGRGADWVKKFAEKNGYTAPILLDPKGEVAGLFAIKAFPTTMILRPDGAIAKRWSDELDYQSDSFQKEWAKAASAPAAESHSAGGH